MKKLACIILVLAAVACGGSEPSARDVLTDACKLCPIVQAIPADPSAAPSAAPSSKVKP